MHPPRTTLLAASLFLATTQAVTTTLPSAVRWTVEISASPAAPPVVDNDQVFIVLQSGVVAAHRIVGDGTEAWHASLRSDFPVAVEGGRVYVAAADAIHALNAADGAAVWLAPSGKVTAPLLAHAGWIIAATDRGLDAFRSADGSKVWSRDVGAIRLTPTIEADNLYVPLEDGRLLALNLPTGEERWARDWGATSEVLALPDRIYLGGRNKDLYCLRADTGDIDWRQRLGAIIRGRPVADEKRIYLTSMDNTVRAFRRSTGALLWHPSVPFRPTTGPVLIDSAVVVSGNAVELRAFDAATGKPAGQITLPESVAVPPAFGRAAEGVVMAAFTGSLNGQWKLVLTAPPPPAAGVPPG